MCLCQKQKTWRYVVLIFVYTQKLERVKFCRYVVSVFVYLQKKLEKVQFCWYVVSVFVYLQNTWESTILQICCFGICVFFQKLERMQFCSYAKARTKSACSGELWSGEAVAKIQKPFVLVFPFSAPWFIYLDPSPFFVSNLLKISFLCIGCHHQRELLSENECKGRIRVSPYWISWPELTYHPYLCGDHGVLIVYFVYIFIVFVVFTFTFLYFHFHFVIFIWRSWPELTYHPYLCGDRGVLIAYFVYIFIFCSFYFLFLYFHFHFVIFIWCSWPELTYHPYLCGDQRPADMIAGPIIHPTLDRPDQTSDIKGQENDNKLGRPKRTN